MRKLKMINRNNAEAFFLDYYEGNLSEGQVAEMFAFLKSNPDLRDIFESFGDVSLNIPESPIPNSPSPVPDFSFLKKEHVVDEHEKAEQWMVDAIEGVITDDDRSSLDNYFITHPERKNEFAILGNTILHADGDESFGDVSSLKKNSEITADNFDDYAIALVEGTISPSEKKMLEAFVSSHPEFASQLENYRSTKLQPDDSVRIQDKSFLKKSALTVSEDNILELLVAKSEGELSSHEEAAVDEYISRFPEYELELDQVSRARLSPDLSEVFEGKEKLKRGIAIINESNFEQYLVSASEGLLNRDELQAFNAFVAAHPRYRKTIAVYSATRLQPDLSIVCDDKEGFKRKVGGGSAWRSVNMRYAAAAVIVLIFGIYLWMKFASSTGDVPVNPLAKNNNPQQNDNNMVTPEWNNPGANQNDNSAKLADNSFGNDNLSSQPVWVPSKIQDGGVSKKDGTPSPIAVVENPFVPVTIVAERVSNQANDAVSFSDALYNVVFNPVAPPKVEQEDDYISPGQYAMRWVKDKIEGGNTEVQELDQTLAENREEDKNVDGLDLTESAVDRVGDAAANGNVSMDQRDDGTYLHLWNYSVRVGGSN